MNTSPAARQLILEALNQRQDLLIDLSCVTYIDSSGVANLVEGYKAAKQQSIHFGLVGVSPSAEKVLRLARLDQVFPIHRSIADWTRRPDT
jgi:anti-sigma B factor antagonist